MKYERVTVDVNMNCEIILIGNELLIGKIEDTNGKWIIDQLLPFGIETTRITTIKDNVSIIASTLKESLLRKPNYIFTCRNNLDELQELGLHTRIINSYEDFHTSTLTLPFLNPKTRTESIHKCYLLKVEF